MAATDENRPEIHSPGDLLAEGETPELDYGRTDLGGTDLNLTLLFFRHLEDHNAAELAVPLIRYLKATEKRRSILLKYPELAASVSRIATDDPDLAARLGLI